MKNNPFIVIEALDAGGSQTQTDWLVRRLKREGYQTYQYHFPQEDRATGRLIYDKFLLFKNKYPFSKREQALLYIQDFFSRADEMKEILSKKSGKHIIVSDRYHTSTMAYQAAGLSGQSRKKMIDWISWLCTKGQPALPKPDTIIYLDTPVPILLKHLANKKKDYHENKKKLTVFYNSYKNLAKQMKWTVINSVNEQGDQRSIKDIHEEVWQYVHPLL